MERVSKQAPAGATIDMSRLACLEAEIGLLGAMILAGNKAVNKTVACGVTKEDFYRLAHQSIFEACLNLSKRGVEVDIVTVKDELARTGELVEAGDVAYLMLLGDSEFTTANIKHYATIVRDRAAMRAIFTLTETLRETVMYGTDDTSVVIRKLEEETLRISRDFSSIGASTTRDSKNVVLALVDKLIRQEKTKVRPVLFGVKEVDEILGSLMPGELTIVAGRPGKGKTHLGMQYVYNAAKAGVASLIVSVEMSAEQLMQRMALRISGIDGRLIRRDGFSALSEVDKRKFKLALKEIADLPITISDQTNEVLTPAKIESLARQAKIAGTCNFLCLDYIQRVEPDEGKRFDSREQEVAHTSRRMARLAIALDVPVLCLAQINRAGAHNPTMEDLRESGSLEADAHNVALLHAKADDTGTWATHMAQIRIKVEKQREGVTGHADISYNKMSGTFTSLMV